MRQVKYFLFSCFILLNFSVSAQSVGDTIVVPGLNYQSTTRDIVVNFPTNSSISYEKVIMRYAMRCKNGLISPPVTGQTNLGCGEWDYSCNTYITDSTRADSTASSINQYVVYPDTNSAGIYSTTPTWEGTPIIQQTVSLQSVIMEDTASVGQGTINDSTLINVQGNGGKTYLLLRSSELLSAGLLMGNIDGFSFNNVGSATDLVNLKVKIKSTSLTNLSFPDSADFRGIQEVYNHTYNSTSGINRVQFHTPFNWNGTSNLLIELSYKAASGNNKLEIESHSTTAIQSISAANDIAFNFFPSNYAEADNYKGVGGTNSRTVEAWIKTGTANKEIVSWGTNSTGSKFSFRLDANGRLRIEVNGGSYIGTKVLDDDKWHHVALTFSGTSMYHFRFYVDGVRDNPTAVNNVGINTGQSLNVQISRGFHGRYWTGSIDNVRIWSTNLPDTTIANWRYRNLDSSHPNYNNLEMNYVIDTQNNILLDKSPHSRNGTFKSHNSFNPLIGEEHFKSFNTHTNRPNIDLYQGTYNMTVMNDTVIDTAYYKPYSVSINTIFPKTGTVISDSIGIVNTVYWPQNNTLFDLSGSVSSTIPSSNTVSITNSTLPYFQRSASKLEIMSFVTPYGINLDMGINGKAWYFDVSDFIPVLKGNRRMTLERGGQWQEEMDISFLFIVGTPPRDVKDITQIWPVSSRSYTQIIANTYFAPKTLALDTSARSFKVRSAITGHGQQGEFIPRNHFVNVNGGPIEFNRTVWKECAENPVFPQGGTWIYDRAGWCPGMPTDLVEYDISTLVGTADTVNIDYGVSTASGDSRYIVNNQLVSYGAPNFNLDARIPEVISPSNHIEYGKDNPVCNGAEIVLQNSGSTQLTAAVIEYWVNNGPKDTYTWSGTLDFLDEVNVSLPTSASFWSQLALSNNTFYARISTINGMSDQYIQNDTAIRHFQMADLLPSNFYIQFTSNSAAFESSYDLRDDQGAVIFQRTSLSNNTTYRDTFNLTTGCYTFNVYDSDDDGISFFGNTNGNGSVRLNEVGGSFTNLFNPNFGDGFSYNFTVGTTVGIEELNLNKSVSIYPNPAKDQLFIETTGLENSDWVIYDRMGRKIESSSLNNTHYSRFSINVSDYANGMYFIHFIKNEKSSIEKFIISR